MKYLLLIAFALPLTSAMPDAPKSHYSPQLQQKYGPPSTISTSEYRPPAAPEEPAHPLPAYGPPAAFYGPPAVTNEAIVTRNVYVHVPPEEPETYYSPAPIQAGTPKKHYKIIFIKAPTPPAPLQQSLSPPVQDEHKTLVYVLVKKPEQQLPLVVPSPAPTEPSKPEVYFIKYKQQQKPASQYGPPPAPNSEYGPPTQAEKF